MTNINTSITIKSWRDVLPVHPAAMLLPRMTDIELKELGADIAANGLHTPVVILINDDATEQLLDGVNRLDAMERAGIEVVKNGEFNRERILHQYIRGNHDPYRFVLSVNLYRRHLTNDQKNELIGKLLELKPAASDRQIATLTGASHPTVAKVEAGGKISTSPTRTDKRGREQPATKVPKAVATATMPVMPKAVPTVPVASARGSAEPAVVPPDPSPDNLGQLIEAIDRVYQLGHADSVLISAALTQQAKKKIQKCLRELAGTLRTLRNEITKSTNITKADATHLIGCKLTCSADVDTALKDWRRRPSHELPDLALAVRRAAGHGLHLSEKQWRTIHEIEAKAVIAGMQAA